MKIVCYQGDISCLASNGTSRSHSDTYISARKRRRIINAISNHNYFMTSFLKLVNHSTFVFGQHISLKVINTGNTRDT